MKKTMVFFTIVTFVNGIFAEFSATTVFQQIQGGISLIIAAVLFSGISIVNAIAELGKKPEVKATETNESVGT